MKLKLIRLLLSLALLVILITMVPIYCNFLNRFGSIMFWVSVLASVAVWRYLLVLATALKSGKPIKSHWVVGKGDIFFVRRVCRYDFEFDGRQKVVDLLISFKGEVLLVRFKCGSEESFRDCFYYQSLGGGQLVPVKIGK